MEKINQRKAMRTRFMNELFEMADGSELNYVATKEITEKLGLVFEMGKDFDEGWDIVQYLEQEGLIKSIGNQPYMVKLTHWGIREIEQAKSEPDIPTEHFVPINNITIHTMINSAIQQDSPGATQKLTILGYDHTERLKTLCRELRDKVEEIDLEETEKAELEAEISTLEAQAVSPKPKKEVVQPSLQSAKNILEGTASGVTAQGIIEGISLLLSSL